VGRCDAASPSCSASALLAPSGGARRGDCTRVGATSPLVATRRSPAVRFVLRDYRVDRDASVPRA